jgi:hypothetical protein
MRTGVRSFQLNGTPVASGRVKRFDRRDDDLVRIALGALHLEEALGAGAAALVH